MFYSTKNKGMQKEVIDNLTQPEDPMYYMSMMMRD